MNHFVILDIFGRFGWSWQNLNTGHFDGAKISIFLMIKCCQMLAKIDCKKSTKNCFVRNTARSCHNVSSLQIITRKYFTRWFHENYLSLRKWLFWKRLRGSKNKKSRSVDFDLTLIKVTRQLFFCQKNDTFDCYCKVLISLTKYFPKIP